MTFVSAETGSQTRTNFKNASPLLFIVMIVVMPIGRQHRSIVTNLKEQRTRSRHRRPSITAIFPGASSAPEENISSLKKNATTNTEMITRSNALPDPRRYCLNESKSSLASEISLKMNTDSQPQKTTSRPVNTR